MSQFDPYYVFFINLNRYCRFSFHLSHLISILYSTLKSPFSQFLQKAGIIRTEYRLTGIIYIIRLFCYWKNIQNQDRVAAVDVSYTDKCMPSAIISMCKKPTSISQKKEKIKHHAFFFLYDKWRFNLSKKRQVGIHPTTKFRPSACTSFISTSYNNIHWLQI
jgi:hypothetical protein